MRARATQAASVFAVATRTTCSAASKPSCPAPRAAATRGSFSSRGYGITLTFTWLGAICAPAGMFEFEPLCALGDARCTAGWP